MKRITFFLILTVLILHIPILKGKEFYNLHFQGIKVDTGLSESSVFSILQDTHGYMWFGTKDGLNRYDGSSFSIYRGENSNVSDNNSLHNNFIRSLLQKNDSLIYVGTDAGLYILNIIDNSFTPFHELVQNGYQITTAITSLLKDRKGDLWIGTMLEGVFVYNSHTNSLKKAFAHKHHLERKAIWTIYEGKAGVIWIGTRGGLLRYNEDLGHFNAVKGMFFDVYQSEHEILSICEDDNGLLWLGTWNDGLRLYNKNENTYLSFLNDKDRYRVTQIRSLFQYKPNHLLVGSDVGLYNFNTETFESYRIDNPDLEYSLSDHSVYSIAQDKEGGLWIGTYFGGVNYLPPFSATIEVYHHSKAPFCLHGNAISQFCEDSEGNLWIATEDGGLNYFDTRTKRITQPVKTSYNNIHALLIDDQKLWIGTFSRGLDIYNTQTGTLKNVSSSVNNQRTINDDCIFSLYKDKEGIIYVGTTIGLNRYNKESNDFTRISEAEGFIYDIKEDDYGNLWVATYGNGVKKGMHNRGNG